MKNEDCVQFLQWALPRMHMRWPGFRRVRGQVCKRIDRRIAALGISGIGAYRAYLEARREEWAVLDSLARVTVSRFYRDRQVFDRLRDDILPARAQAAAASGRARVNICSLGCGSGEEPYSVALIWNIKLQPTFPDVDLRIVAVDADPNLLERARKGCYHPGSLKELPDDLRGPGFVASGGEQCLRHEHKRPVELVQADIRQGVSDGPCDIVMCRNLAFTYFDEHLQASVARDIHDALQPGGVLVTGAHERPPEGHPFESEPDGRYFFRRPLSA